LIPQKFDHFISSWRGVEHCLPGHTHAMQLSEVQIPCEFLDGRGVTGQKVVVLWDTG